MTTLASLRVGRLPYLNALPFAGPFAGDEPRWVTDVPRRLGEHAAAGRLDAALLASRDALALADRFRPLADLGIACLGPVGSVLLFSDRPVGELDGATVALTSESRTSRALLRILLHEAWGVRPRYVEHPARADACLAIGDAALELRASDRWPWMLDLGAAWAHFTDLPFVYARWVVRRDLPVALENALTTELGARLDAPRVGVRENLPRGMTPASARAYLDRFTNRLGPAEVAGLQRFHRELIRHDLLRHHCERARIGSAA
jgi:chorismate dehydratase